MGAPAARRDADAQKSTFKPYHAVNVPRSMNLNGQELLADGHKTTAMLRNIPNRYTQASLLHEIDCAGFEGTYDFFYLPMDTHNRTNVGYAFINFVEPADMTRFTNLFSGYRFKDHSSQKIARVSPAHLQGFHENVRHFSNRAVTHSRNSQYRPVIVQHGKPRTLGEALATPASAAVDCPWRMDPDAMEFVPSPTAVWNACSDFAAAAPVQWPLEAVIPAALPEPAVVPVPFALKSEEPSYVGNGAPGLSASSAFDLAKFDFQVAISKLLKEQDAIASNETSSTEGDSCDHSTSASVRSMSPVTEKSVCMDKIGDIGFPPGLEPAWIGTPRTHKTHLSMVGRF